MDIRAFFWCWKKGKEVLSLILPSSQENTTGYDYSVIIPAYNEEKFLPKTLESLELACQELNTYSGEWIVVDNNSTDNTVDVAKKYGCKVVPESIRQISRVRNTGAKNARGKYFIFLDADTIVPPSTLYQAIQALEGEEILCGGAKLSFDNHHGRWFSGRCLPSMWNFISQKMKLFAGSFIFCRSDLFFKCGGFPESHYAGEEIILSKKLKKECRKMGKKVLVISSPKVISSARKLLWYNDWSIFKMMIPLIGLPFFLKNHQACKFWYNRPTKD